MLYKKLIAGPTRIEINKRTIDDLFKKITGMPVESMSRASESYTNEVYSARLKQGSKYYLKFFDDEFHPDRAKAELKAMDEANKLGIPTPTIVHTDFSRSDFKRDFAVFEQADGKELLTEKLTPQIAKSCIDTLAKLHTLQNKDYGFLYVSQKHWEKGKDYFDFLDDVIVYGLKKIEKQGNSITGLHEAHTSHRSKIKYDKYCLNHNDFTAKHIFTDGSSITCVIDWEWNAFMTPINDYTIFINSLLDKGVKKSTISSITDQLTRTIDNFEEINFYMGRRFLLGAIFPHKNKLNSNFPRRKLLFGRLLLKGEITFEDFVEDIYEKNTFAN